MGSEPDERAVAGQFDALRQGAGVFVLDDCARLRARGADRASFLQGMVSNEVAKLATGQGTRALLLTEQGKVVADLYLRVDADAIRLEVERDAVEPVRAALERFIVADDVELEDLPGHALALRGPKARAILQEAVAPDESERVAALAGDDWTTLTIDGVVVECARCTDLGAEGFRTWTGDDSAGRMRVLRALVGGGALEVGAAAIEAFRIAGGVARAGVDYDRQTLAAEVLSLAPAISFRKGCYLGQEVVERIAARGHVNWSVVPLLATGTAVPAVLARVLSGDDEVGRVSSAARLPGAETIAMLARVRRTAAEPGLGVEIETTGGRLEARVGEFELASKESKK